MALYIRGMASHSVLRSTVWGTELLTRWHTLLIYILFFIYFWVVFLGQIWKTRPLLPILILPNAEWTMEPFTSFTHLLSVLIWQRAVNSWMRILRNSMSFAMTTSINVRGPTAFMFSLIRFRKSRQGCLKNWITFIAYHISRFLKSILTCSQLITFKLNVMISK